MDRESVRTVVRVTLLALKQIAGRTRTPTDDLMTSILQGNQERIVDAVMDLLDSPSQPPGEAEIVEALKRVGIRV